MLRVRTLFTGIGGSMVNTLHFTGSTQTEADNAAAAVSTFWLANRPLMSDDITFSLDTEVLELGDDGVLTGVFSVAASTAPGQATGDIIPMLQGLAKFRTGAFLGGVEIRGRMFVPGVTETHNLATGQPSGTYISDLLADLNALVADANSELRVWSRTKQASAPVTSVNIAQSWARLDSRRV